MRYYPAALALSLLAGVTASMGYGATPSPAPRAASLIAEGRQALDAGQPQTAIDSFEAALAVDPAYTPVYLDLAKAARTMGMQGKAIRYYRQTLDREPANYAALSGEGEALVEKGAVEKARRNLTKLQSMCGDTCKETRALAAAIDAGAKAPVLTAEAMIPEAAVTQN